MSEEKLFSLKDIATHNSNKSSWIVIHNNVSFHSDFCDQFKLNINSEGRHGMFADDKKFPYHLAKCCRHRLKCWTDQSLHFFIGVRCDAIFE